MPCIPFKGTAPNGTPVSGFICTRGRRDVNRCAICGAPSTNLCDFEVAPDKPCDTPLCARCATHVEPDNDFCPKHKPGLATVRRCRVCGCTDNYCRQCIEKTGEPCHWVEADLCSACAPDAAVLK